MKLFTLICITILCCHMILGDERHFVWTYESQMTPPGEAELETYLTTSASDAQEWEHTTSTVQQFELEVGMSEHLDFGIYQLFKTNPGQAVTYEGFKLRWRYRLPDRLVPAFSPIAYVEYKGSPGFSEHEIETKLILTHSMNRWTFAVNPQIAWEYDDSWNAAWKVSAGLNFRLHKLLAPGMEAFVNDQSLYAGPVISHGKGDKWVALGGAFRLRSFSGSAPEVQIRLIMGFGL